MAVTTVPPQDPTQSQLVSGITYSPYSLGWWTSQFITTIPADSVGWLVAQGWQITGITYDPVTTPPTPYYAMYRESMQNWKILQSMLNEYTDAYNEARRFNDTRYNEIIVDWTEMLETSQTHFDTQTTEQNTQATIYLTNLDTYMNEVNTKIGALETDFAVHSPQTTGFLVGLGTTEEARINQEFAASLATQVQQLIDRGLYSSAVLTDITARNTRDRDEQIQLLKDRLNREKLDNQHKLYEQQFRMGTRQIGDLMNEHAARLAGTQQVHADNMRLMAYQLDERNKMLVGLYGFVERRDDVGPQFSEFAKICTSLGDAGGGWVTP